MGLGPSGPSVIHIYENEEGVTNLHRAALDNNVRLVKKLLSKGAKINAKNRFNETPLHYAASQNEGDSHYEVIETLLMNGATVDAESSRELIRPLYFLVQKGNVKIVKLLLDYNADLKSLTSPKCHLLFSAIYNRKNLDVLQFLINLSLDVNHCDRYGKTTLHDVATFNVDDNCMDVAELLLKNGADLNIRDREDYTPLLRLVENGNARIIQLFLNHATDFDIKSEYGQTLFLKTIQYNKNVDAVQLMIDLGSDVHFNYNKESEERLTVLHHACKVESTSIKIIKCLLKNGANMNLNNSNKATPLAYAMRNSFISLNDDGEQWEEKVKLLVEHTDLYINVSKNSHFLDWYCDEPPRSYKKVLQHIAKLLALNIPVHPVLLDAVKKNSPYYKYYIEHECNEELKLAKSTKLGNSWITFYNLLLDSRKKLKNYAGNRDLIEVFQKSDCEKKFPIYGSSMVENVYKAIKRRELYDKSVDLLSDCLPIFHPTHLIIRDIMDCILCKKDLSKFCD